MLERNITTTLSTSRSTSPGRLAVLVLILFQTAFPGTAQADDEYRQVSVAEPYLELRTGAGIGYPVFHIVDRGTSVEIIMRRTDWFLVRGEDGVEGWADRAQMEKTLQTSGSEIVFAQADQEDFTNAKWELGLMTGDFGGSNSIAVYGGYSLNPYVALEVWGSQILGNSSNGWMGSANVVLEAFPDWRVSPFFTLGAGIIHIEPKPTIVIGEDRTDEIGHAGAGFRIYSNRRFILRAEFKSYVVFTSRDDNEEIEEWKVGFAFFF